MQPSPIRKQPEPVKLEDLRDAVEGIAFEMYYFRKFSNIRKDPKQYLKFIEKPSPSDHLPRCVGQGLGYVLLLHFRVLFYFFYYPPKDDDCSVEHFKLLPHFAARFSASIHVPPDNHKTVRRNLNKRLAHFSAERWREKPQPDWASYERFFPQIEILIVRFEEALPMEYKSLYDAKRNYWAQGD